MEGGKICSTISFLEIRKCGLYIKRRHKQFRLRIHSIKKKHSLNQIFLKKEQNNITLMTSCARTPPTIAQTGASSAKSRLNSSSDTLSTGTDSWPCKYQLFMIGRFRLRSCSAKSRLNSSSDRDGQWKSCLPKGASTFLAPSMALSLVHGNRQLAL